MTMPPPTTYSVRRRRPRPYALELLARAGWGFLAGLLICAAAAVVAVLAGLIIWLTSLGVVPGLLAVAGVICLLCAVFALLR